MSHPDEGLFHALLDGELAPDEARAIEAHVETCAACAERLASARAIFEESNALVDRLEMPDRAPVGRRAPGAATAPAPLAPPHSQVVRPRYRLRNLAWAATVVMAAGLGFWAGDWRHRLPGEGEVASTPSTAKTTTEAAPSAAEPTPLTTPDSERSSAFREQGAPAARQRLSGPVPAPSTDDRFDRRQAPSRANNEARDAVAPSGRAAAVPEEGKAREAETAVARELDEVRQAERSQLADGAAGLRSELAPQPEGQAQGAGVTQNRAVPSAPVAAPAPTPAARALDQAVVGGAGEVANAKRQPAEERAGPGAAGARTGAAITPIGIEQAIGLLNGAMQLIEGTTPERVETAPAPALDWGVARSPWVRAVYRLDGAEIVLSQLILESAAGRDQAEADVARVEDRSGSIPQLALGDTLFSTTPGGEASVWWLDGSHRLLTLTGPVSQEVLRDLLRRVR